MIEDYDEEEEEKKLEILFSEIELSSEKTFRGEIKDSNSDETIGFHYPVKIDEDLFSIDMFNSIRRQLLDDL